MKTRKVCFTGTMVLLMMVGLVSDALSQSAPVTAGELVENSALRAHVEALEKGEIVLMTYPEHEKANQLNVLMAIFVPASLDKTVDTLQRQATAEDAPGMLAIGEIKGGSSANPDKAFAGVAFTAEEKDEVEKMMVAAPGKRFNFSREEIATIQKRADGVKGADRAGPEAIRAMSLAMRDVLKGRYQAYQQQGLDGLAPYQEAPSTQIQPSRELISATESLMLVKERFPGYYACLRWYPRKQSATLVHQFFWAKQTESGRPLFMLKHWVLDIQPGYALITERRFYLNHSLSALQVVIGCLPHQEGTLVVLLNQAFTEKVNMSIGKGIAKKIGYREVEKNIRPMFEHLRSALRP